MLLADAGDIFKYLDHSKIEKYKEAFQLYDKDEDGTISSKELGALLRCLGQNPSQEDIVEMIDVRTLVLRAYHSKAW